MRSTSDEEALNSKEQDLEDDLDSIRSPFYKPRTPLRYPLSPQSPPSDESSYQGSSAAHSDRSFNGHGNGTHGGAGGGSASGGGQFCPSGLSEDSRGTSQEDELEEALLRPFYLPEYKH